ncbi:twin transmembrane helix small protein [Uliginosibacterium sp. H3]|uniref:Twin transmembrane helix small protein n=1 Tax=Uliginosibacterium silvisoli TaxID=3114758 RepID=A0ABU6K303_9RHOO|nr:twin transmembrane helix small protein [Uliginosibacterium sp. H3]
MRWVVIALLLAIMASLGSGLFSLVKDKSNSDRTVRALTWRIGLSLLLFLLVLLIYRMGWVSGHLLG